MSQLQPESCTAAKGGIDGGMTRQILDHNAFGWKLEEQ